MGTRGESWRVTVAAWRRDAEMKVAVLTRSLTKVLAGKENKPTCKEAIPRTYKMQGLPRGTEDGG